MAVPCFCSWVFGVLCILVVFPLSWFIAAPAFIDLPGNVKDGTDTEPQKLPKFYVDNGWVPDCVPDGFMDAFATYWENTQFEKVSYNSRKGKADQEIVELTGWWVAPKTADAPRIVVQHGMGGNANNLRTQSMAYFLHTMGYGVLINNFRDHGFSDSSTLGKVLWGWAYPNDVLGAWDYATKDPDKKLGGELSPKKVGIVGYSMGGFSTATAFGMEKNIPAVWLDSAAFSPKDGLFSGAAKGLPGGQFTAGLLIEPAYAISKVYAGADLDYNTPSKTFHRVRLPSDPLLLCMTTTIQMYYSTMRRTFKRC